MAHSLTEWTLVRDLFVLFDCPKKCVFPSIMADMYVNNSQKNLHIPNERMTMTSFKYTDDDRHVLYSRTYYTWHMAFKRLCCARRAKRPP